MQILKGHRSNTRVRSLAFSPDGARLASASLDHRALLWDLSTGKHQLIRVAGFCVTFAPDGRQVAIGAEEGLCLWNLDTGLLRTLNSDVESGRLAFSPDGRVLATVGRTVRLWDVATLRPLATGSPSGPGYPDTSHEVPPRDGLTLGTAHDYDLATNALAFTPDGLTLATAHESYIRPRFVSLWDTPSWKQRYTLTGHRYPVDALAFSPDGLLLAAAAGHTLWVWDVASHEPVLRHKISAHHFKDVAFSPDGRFLAFAHTDPAVGLLDTSNWKQEAVYDWGVGVVVSIAFAPDGMRAAAGSAKGKVVVWDIDL